MKLWLHIRAQGVVGDCNRGGSGQFRS